MTNILRSLAHSVASRARDHSKELVERLDKLGPEIGARKELVEHSLHWQEAPVVKKVTDGVYLALGYDLANSICIELETGLMIIDTLTDAAMAKIVCQEFRRLCNQKTIQMIVITHNHGDHFMGIRGFIDDQPNANDIIIYAHTHIAKGLQRSFLPALQPRNARQFGTLMEANLPKTLVQKKQWYVNAGIGPHFRGAHYHHENDTRGTGTDPVFTLVPFSRITPIGENTVIVDKQSGEKIEILCAPGETDDQLMIWLEKRRVLCPADNFYYAFPNLYAIRGSTPRNVKAWIGSVDRMRDLKPKYVVGSHCDYVEGEEHVMEELTLYRDTISFVHDQTLRLMNHQLHLDEIIEKVLATLPQRMKQGRVQQFYGTVEWSIRAIYTYYVGWFTGEPADMYPATFRTRGKHMVYLISQMMQHVQSDQYSQDKDCRGAPGALLKHIVMVMKQILQETPVDLKKDIVAYPEERFVLETVTWILSYLNNVNKKNHDKENEKEGCVESMPSDEKQKWIKELYEIRWKVMRDIASRSFSANGRNYLVSYWLQEQFQIIPQPTLNALKLIKYMPLIWWFDNLQLRVDPEKCEEDLKASILLKLKDESDIYWLELRGPVLEVRKFHKDELSIARLEELEKNALLVYLLSTDEWMARQFISADHLKKGTKKDLLWFWSKFDKMNLSNKPRFKL